MGDLSSLLYFVVQPAVHSLDWANGNNHVVWQEQQTLDSQRDKSFYLCTNTGAHTSFTMVPVDFQGNNIQ